MASNRAPKGSVEQADTPSEATPPKDSLTPRERLRKKLNSMPPKQRQAVVKRALAIWSQNRQKRRCVPYAWRLWSPPGRCNHLGIATEASPLALKNEFRNMKPLLTHAVLLAVGIAMGWRSGWMYAARVIQSLTPTLNTVMSSCNAG